MLKVANIFSNDMVLQRDKNITVWGLGDEERTVTVTLNGVSVQTQVCDGRWTAVLPPMSAGGEYEMTVSDGCTEKTFRSPGRYVVRLDTDCLLEKEKWRRPVKYGA